MKKKIELKEQQYHGLCFRCDHRAKFLEIGSQPRYECGQTGQSVCGCYMYKPVKPVILKRNKGDRRPQFAGYMLSARSRGVRIPTEREFILNFKKYKDGNVIYWAPKTRK
jgi:hypothetical protein